MHVLLFLLSFLSAAPAWAWLPGQIGAWAFREGTGSTAADATSGGVTLTFTNATWTTGRQNSAFNSDGTTDYAQAADPASIAVTGTALTLSVWAKASAPAVGAYLINKSNGASTGYALYTGASATLRCFIGTGSLQFTADTVASPWNNTWRHLACVYNGATLKIYVDGGEVVSTAITGSISASPAHNFTVGADPNGNLSFAGALDNVRVYNRALSADEIRVDMRTPVGQSPGMAPMTGQ